MLNNSEFKRKIIKRINSKFQGKEKRELEKTFLSRLSDRTEVFGSTFFEISKIINEDLDDLCNMFFNKNNFIKLSLCPTSDNKFRDFINPFTFEIQEIAAAVISDTSRVSRLKDGKIKNLYVHEVYGLAIAFGLKPSQLFNYFYGDGERPIICLAPEEQEEGENKDT